MLKNLIFVSFLFATCTLFAQENIEDDVKISYEGTNLTIKIDDPKVEKYDLLIYKTYEDIKINDLDVTKNPIEIDIKDWDPAIYHIKIDYAHTTQFRHYEIIKDF